MELLRLVKVETKRLFWELRYYAFNQAVGLLDLLLICLGLFTGIGRDLFPGRSLFYAWTGMILWRYAMVGLQSVCRMVQKELRLGTLEQLMLTRSSFDKILLARMLAQLLAETVKLGAVSLLLCRIFRIRPAEGLPAPLFILSVLLFLLGVAGMSWMIGGVSLIYKKANALVNAISYYMLFFAGAVVPLQAIPHGFSWPARALPFYWCLETLRRASPGPELLALAALSAAWLLLGVGAFRAAMRHVTEKGSPAQF